MLAHVPFARVKPAGAPPGGDPVLVREPQAFFQSGTNSFSYTFPAVSTAGSTLVLLCLRYARLGGTWTNVTDNQGGSWTIENTAYDESSFLWAQCQNCPAGVDRITVTSSDIPFGSNLGWLWECDSGGLSAFGHIENPFDQINYHAAVGGVTAGAGVWMACGWQANAFVDFTHTPGWTRRLDATVQERVNGQDVETATGFGNERARIDYVANQRGSSMIGVVTA